LKEASEPCCYHFYFLSPEDYMRFFKQVRSKELRRLAVWLDARIGRMSAVVADQRCRDLDDLIGPMIVHDMWLTGVDTLSLCPMYVGKPVKVGHKIAHLCPL
jgi:hypothetical protein